MRFLGLNANNAQCDAMADYWKTMPCYHGVVGSPPLPNDHPIHQFVKDFDDAMIEAIEVGGGLYD